MSAETVPGTDIRYHLVAFDAHGRERDENGGPYSPFLLREAATTRPTDVFVFSHGWNSDVAGARSQYGRWIATMESCAEDRAVLEARPGGYRPLLVGLHWPSKAWSDEQLPGEPAATAVGEPDGGTEWLVDYYAARLTDTARTREALRTILESAHHEAVPTFLPDPVRRAYQVIDAEAGAGSDGEGAAPGDDREPFDAEETYQACQVEELASFGGASLGGVLSPLRVLTFWQMKRRALKFGERGAATLLGDLRAAAPTARFHLMGHSFGCIVVSAAITTAVDTLVLVQGAMSLWSFCPSIPSRPDRHGYFHRLVADGLVRGPLLATTSVHDRAVGVFYPLGARARRQVDYAVGTGTLPTYGGIGTFGVRGLGDRATDEILGLVDAQYDFQPRTVHNLDASAVIRSGGGASGAHSDICHPPLAHAIWQAVAADGNQPVPSAPPPPDADRGR